MKLTIDRREKEEKEGLLRRKVTVYYLDVSLEATPEELKLIEKHKWNEKAMCTGEFKHTQWIQFTMRIGGFLKGPFELGFKTIEELSSVENQIIENSKTLKANLESVEDFSSGGPREIEL